MYSIKMSNNKWLVVGVKYEFTKSKADFIVASLVKRGLFISADLVVVKAP